MRVVANRTEFVLPRWPSHFPNSDQINVFLTPLCGNLGGGYAYRTKNSLAEALRQRRQDIGLSQVDLAAKLRSSQSRIANMEADDSSVSLDLLIRSLITLGVSDRALSKIIATPRAA